FRPVSLCLSRVVAHVFSLISYLPPLDPSSFPTRRSSDLLDSALHSQFELLVRDKARQALVDVRNLDKVAYQVVRQVHGKPDFPSPHELAIQWGRHAKGRGVAGRFLVDEGEHVVLAQNLRTERDYLETYRYGRGRAGRLGTEQKRRVWRAILAATQEMRVAGQWTFTWLASEAT